MSGFDGEQLRNDIREKLRPVFADAMARESENGIYAFFLRTVDTGEIVTAVCNTTANLREQCILDEGEEFPSREDDEFAYSDYCAQRWGDAEWEEEIIDYAEGTFRLDEPLARFYEQFPDDHFGGAAYAAMILAMRDLDGEGVLGEGELRDAITLFCGSSDGDPEWLFIESAQRLNSPEIAQRFAEEWRVATGIGAKAPHKPSGAQYLTFLQWIEGED